MNPPASRTPINFDQHCLFVGTTGAGKTERTKKQLRWRIQELNHFAIPKDIYKIIVIDTKPMHYGGDDEKGHFADIPDAVISRDWHKYNPNGPRRVFVLRPKQGDIHPALFDGFFKYLASLQYVNKEKKESQKPFLLVMDELTDIITQDGKRVVYVQSLD